MQHPQLLPIRFSVIRTAYLFLLLSSSANEKRLQSLRTEETSIPDPSCNHQPSSGRSRPVKLNSRVHLPRQPLRPLQRHLHRSLEQIPDRLFSLHPRPTARPAHRRTTCLPKHHRKPSCRSAHLPAMAPNDGLAALDRQRLPLLDIARHLHDIQIPHRNSPKPRRRHRPILQAINGDSRHRLGPYPPKSRTHLVPSH